MSCGRCGSNKSSRPAPPPSVVNRPGTMAPTPVRPSSSPSARDTITGLKYVPSNPK